VTLSLELTADLPVEGLLVGFDGQEHVGPLGEAPSKNDCVVCRAGLIESLVMVRALAVVAPSPAVP
jgi:hypothetical protein